jgi:purine-nucleoside phosphorylase
MRILLLLTLLLPACTAPLAEYSAYSTSQRYNAAADYIAYLKTQSRFAHGELDHLPRNAIIFYGDPVPLLTQLGYAPRTWTTLDLGTTDLETLYIVRPDAGSPFIVARGIPGAGGITTEAAELAALGAARLVHIGTSGAIGPHLQATDIVVSTGAYRDGAAVMLATDNARLSLPSPELSSLLTRQLQSRHLACPTATGYTIPIYYSQPSGLIRALLSSPDFASPRPEYIEMEESSFFEQARTDHIQAASLTVPADRYTLANGSLSHDFLDDAALQKSLQSALAATVAVFNKATSSPPK